MFGKVCGIQRLDVTQSAAGKIYESVYRECLVRKWMKMTSLRQDISLNEFSEAVFVLIDFSLFVWGIWSK